jgi:hypothetical protein
VPGVGSHRTTRGGEEGSRDVAEGSCDVVEGNREIEDDTRKGKGEEGRVTEGEATTATLMESDRHGRRSRIQRPRLAEALTLSLPTYQEIESSVRTGQVFLKS